MLLKWTGSKSDEDEARVPGDQGTVSRETGSPFGLILGIGTVLWFGAALFYINSGDGLSSLLFMYPHEQAQVLIALFLPPVLAWLVALVVRRSQESARSRSALLEVLADLAGPDQEAEARLNATAMSLRRISQTVEGELGNALARADDLNIRIDTGLSRLAELSEGAGRQSEQAGELLEQAGGEQRRLLEDLQSLGEQTRNLSRMEGSELSAAVENAARRADEIAVSLDSKARVVSETVENVSRRAAELGAAVDQPMNRLREESEQTVRRMNSASQELKTRVEALSQEMGRTVDQAGQASQGVDASAVRLRQVTGEMRGLLSGTGEEVKQRINELQELVSGTMRSSDQAAQRLDQRLGQFAGSLDSLNVSAGEAEEVLAASVDRVAGMLGIFSDQASVMQEAASETIVRTENAASGVLEASASFGAASRQIDTANQKLAVSRDEISATVSHLAGLTEETVSGLERRIREVSSFAEGASERSGEKLQKVTLEIAGAARSLGRQLAVMEEQARGSEAQAAGSADIISMRLGELKALLTEIVTESGRSDEGMKQLAESSRHLLDGVTAHVVGMNTAVENSAVIADQSVEAITGSLDQVRRASSETEARLGSLANALVMHAEGLDDVSNRLSATAANIEGQAAARLEQVAGSVEAITSTADAKLGELASRLGNLFGDLQSRSGQMTEAVDAATGRTQAAGGRLTDAMAEMSLLLQEVDESVSNAGDSFGHLDKRVRGVAEAIRGGVEDNLVLMEDRSREVTGRLFDTAQELSAASEELERRSGLSLQRLSDLRGQTVGQLGDVEGRLTHLTDLWRERTDLFENAAGGLQRAAGKLEGETADRLVSFTARLAEAADSARGAVNGLEGERLKLVQTGKDTEASLDGITAELELRLAAAADRAVAGATAMRGQVDALEKQAGDLAEVSTVAADSAGENAGRIEHLMQGVQALSVAMTAEVERLASTAQTATTILGEGQSGLEVDVERMKQALSESAQAIAGEGDRVANALGHLNAELTGVDAEMSGRMAGLEQSVRGATDLAQLTSDALLAGTEAMIVESGRVREEIIGTSEQLAQKIAGIRGAGEDVAARISGASSELEIRVDALKAAGAEAETDVAQRADNIARRMQELTEVSSGSQAAWEDGARSIELTARTSEAHSRSALAALQEALAALDEALPRTGGLEASAVALQQHGTSLVETIADLERQGGETVKRLGVQRDGIADDNRRMTDEMSSGLERLAAGVEEARAGMRTFVTAEHAAAQAVEDATGRMDTHLLHSQKIATELGERGTELDSRLASRIKAVEAAEKGASEAAELLAECLSREQERLSGMRDLAMSDAETFAGSIASALDDLKGRSDDFSSHVTSLHQAAEQLKADMAGSAVQIAADAASAAEVGERIAEATDQSARKLAEQREAFALSAEDADRATVRARKVLAEQATAIASASQAANMQAGLAAKSFENQATRLEEAARHAADAAVKLDDTSRDSRDRRFLTSAAEVAGGLNSMALDLHRLLDAEATETNWARYQSGDRGLFTRRLVNRSNRKQIAGAYNSDGTFRRHVDHYVSEFEAVLGSAIDSDHDGLLTGIFMSADVGKLYLVLCDALDRRPVNGSKR
jgi:hypothetical protein